jgi:inner membrane transporter RhtA
MGKRQPPPQAYFVVSAVFHYLGPSFAVLLFARVEVLGVAWLRIASAALVFAIWRRPWRRLRGASRSELRVLIAWGALLAVMNCCFYEAIHRVPLGTVAAIEFLPVIALAAIGTRTGRNAGALVLAVAGVYLLSHVQLAGQPLGLAFAFTNAGLFSLYIVLAHRVAQETRTSGIDGLAMAMLIALLVVTPIGGWQVTGALGDPVALLAGAGVGISSSVIPYVSDQLAMVRLSRATYSLMVALLPATATIVGIVVLAQVPTVVQLLGVALVVAGVAVHRDSDAEARPKPDGRAEAYDSTGTSGVGGSGAAGALGASGAAGALGASGPASAARCAPAAPAIPIASAAKAAFGPCQSGPSDGSPGPTSASVSAAAISTTLYS